MTVILENVHDPHNLGAVMRSCDAVGITELYVLNHEPSLYGAMPLGKRSSAGSRKWVDVKVFYDIDECFEAVRTRYEKVYGTVMSEPSVSVYDLDMTGSCALLFGNESEGVGQKVADMCDGHFIIPMVGMAESLNISVACGVSLFEAYRQRLRAGLYDKSRFSESESEILFDDMRRRAQVMKGFIKANSTDTIINDNII